MVLSIIVATKGRKDEVEDLLESISGYDLNLIEVLKQIFLKESVAVITLYRTYLNQLPDYLSEQDEIKKLMR